MRRFATSTSFFLLAAVAACGTGGSSGDDTDAAPGTIDAAPGVADAGAPAGFTKLVGRSWSLKAGQPDTYRCVQITVPNDIYVSAIHAASPLGTHHTVVTISSNPQHADGEWDCGAGALEAQMLFASGVGTDDMVFPDQVGFKIPAGSHVQLNLHLFDATEKDLADETAIYVKEMPTAPDAAHTAEMVFSGTVLLSIPSDNQPHTFSGGCTLKADAKLIALWPHMHQTATHQLVTLTHGSTTTNLLDKPYAFTEQKNYPWATPVDAAAGDQIMTTCTFQNNTGKTVTFGESSLSEMCFTGIYRYPATGENLFSCTVGLGTSG